MLSFNCSQFLLEVDVNQPIPDLGEKLAYGAKMLVVGMGIVFSVIITLYICLLIFKSVCQRINEKRDAQSDTPASVNAAPVTPVAKTSNDEEIVAVIAAAIAAASSEMPDKKFRVVSFKRL